MKDDKGLLKIREAAEILGVNTETLRRWDTDGHLKAVRIGTRRGIGDRRYRREDIENYLSKKIIYETNR